MPGLACPQTAQARIFCGTQVGQTGPPGRRMLTGRRRPQRAHRSRLAGSVTRQCGQTGRPCSSRGAGSRTVPHRPQGTAFGGGAAGAADPQPVQQLAQRDVTPALRACRPLDNGAWRPQAKHVVTGSGRQPGQIGPPGVRCLDVAPWGLKFLLPSLAALTSRQEQSSWKRSNPTTPHR